MSRLAVLKYPALILVGVVLIWAWQWWDWLPRPFDKSVEFDTHEMWGNRWSVQNGTAYDRSTVELGAAKSLVLPEGTTIRRGGAAGTVELFMGKTLSFGGHPGEPVSIRRVRAEMGCAVRAEGDALVVATFGEWDTGVEGGAWMRLLLAVVPDGLAVEHRKGLVGWDCAGQEWERKLAAAPDPARTAHGIPPFPYRRRVPRDEK
jgi:hypothetical protein